MKKKLFPLYFIILVIISLSLWGCVRDNKDDSSIEDPIEEAVDTETEEWRQEEVGSVSDEEIIKEFRLLEKTNPKADLLKAFLDKNIEKVSQKDADEMVEVLENSLEKNIEVYQDKLVNIDRDNELIDIDGQEMYFRESSIGKIKDEKLRTEVKYLYENMYRLVNAEGSFIIIIDYSKFKKYDEYLSDELRSFLKIKSFDSDGMPMADGGLIISYDELVERIFKSEDFLKSYPDAKRRKEVLEEYEFKINAYLSGLPNTPIEDYDSKRIRDKVVESYKKTAKEDYEISHIVAEYLKIIEDNNFIIDNNILLKANELVERAILAFKGSK